MQVGQLRGLQVLEVLAGMEQPASLPALVERTGLSQSQAFRVLQALEREGYVDHLGRRGYRIASRSVAMAATIGPRPALRRAIQPAIAHLVTTLGLSAVMHLRSGRDRVLVIGVPARGDELGSAVTTGERSALHVGCSGRVILAHLPAEQLAVIAPPVSAGLLAAIRERGYDVSSGENHPGVKGIAGPILDDDGAALGSVTIAGTASRMPDSSTPHLVRALLGACRTISPRVASVLGPNPGATVSALDL